MGLSSHIIKECLKQAEKSTYRIQIGAVLFSGKRILSTGFNQIRSSRIKHKEYANSLHAEQDCLRKVHLNWNNLKGSSLLVLKTSKSKKLLSNAFPCEMCRGLIHLLGIKEVWHSNAKGEIVKWKV